MPSPEPDPAPISPYIADSVRRRKLEQEQRRILERIVEELRPVAHAPTWENTFERRLASLKWEKRMKRRRQIHSDRRRALKAGATAGRVDRREIILRDQSICHICGTKCEPHEIHLDHVIPLAKGGAHSPENVKVAHARCNLDKKDLLLSDLASYNPRRRPS